MANISKEEGDRDFAERVKNGGRRLHARSVDRVPSQRELIEVAEARAKAALRDLKAFHELHSRKKR